MTRYTKIYFPGVPRCVNASQRVLLSLALSCVLVGLAAGTGSPARAAVKHDYLSQITEVPGGSGASSPGKLSGVGQMTVDSGDLFVADNLEVSPVEYRLDKFDASTGAFVSQFPQIPALGENGIAVGRATGETVLYAGTGQGSVDVLDSSGVLQASWSGAGTSNGSFARKNVRGEQAGVTGVAVDGSTGLLGDWAEGDVYVSSASDYQTTEASYNVVSVFKPQAGGGEPAKPVAELTGTCVSPGTVCSGAEVVPFSGPQAVAVDASNGEVLVVDGPSQLGVRQVVDIFKAGVITGTYEFVGRVPQPPGGQFETVDRLAVDGGNGDVYVADNSYEANNPKVIFQFVLDPAGEYVYAGSLTGTPAGPFGDLRSVTVDPVSHHVFVGVHNGQEHVGVADVYDKDIVIPDVATEAGSEVLPASFTLHGMVNPDKEGEASCEFVWGTTTEFGQVAPCEPEHVAEGNVPVPVHARLTGLQPDTLYYYRLQATNKNGTNAGTASQDQVVLTPGPGLHGESVSKISATSATLDATINPHNTFTTYYFQYGPNSEYGHETPAIPGGLVGSGEGDVEVERRLQALAPGVTYHYRVVVVSEVKPGVTEAFYSPDQTFTMQLVGSALLLPDGREWELVSPPDKRGSNLRPIGLGVTEASLSGDAITYQGTLPPENNAQGYSDLAQIVSTRTGGGWSSQDVSPPHGLATGIPIGTHEYKFFSEDLSLGLFEPIGAYSSLAPYVSPPDTQGTAYVRHIASCTSMPDSCYTPLITRAPGYADVSQSAQTYFVGATADLAHVILNAGEALTETPIGKEGALYEWSGGLPISEEVRLVSILPASEGAAGEGGKAVAGSLGASRINVSVNVNARHAISADGSRVFWSTIGNQEFLYLRDMSKGETLRLDVVQGGSGEGRAAPRFQTASNDGSVVFFTDEQALTKNSGAANGRADLYECRIVESAGKDACELTDLTPIAGAQDAAVQSAVLGASEDGSYVYFVAGGVLSSVANAQQESPVAGAPNLYMLHYDTGSGVWESPRLVSVLSGNDSPDLGGQGGAPAGMTARVSPNGRYLAFMSDRSLTGYDNLDANSGKPDEEVFLFDAATGRVVCASCDPTGARPVGVANLPVWTEYEGLLTRYQARYLSDDGRLFFDGADALVPQDINKNEDVYEYEPPNVGDCFVSSATFSVHSDGCVGLISSGTAVGESAFLDANSDGSDVFFLTKEQLVRTDVDTAFDVYDAHECSTGSPCVNVPASSPACTTADACRAAPAVQPSSFGPPSSATFSGAGNIVPSAPGAIVKAKGLTRSQQLARALKTCHADRSKRKRTGCEQKAKKRYGKTVKASKGSATGRGGR